MELYANTLIKNLKSKYIEYDTYHKIKDSFSYNETKGVFDINLNVIDDYIKIIPIGDVHYGHKNCDVNAFLKTIEYIKNNKNTYTIIVGDLLETATKDSVGAGVLEESVHLREQITNMIKILEPLAKNNKILCAVDGNHELRIHKMLGITPIQYICDVLKIPYQQYQSYVTINLNSVKYNVMITHGKGSGSSKAARIKSIAKPSDVAPLMDLYISGHLHSDITDKDKVFYIAEDGSLKEHIRRYVMCGSFLKYFDSYAEQAVLPPNICGAPEILLYSSYKHILIIN